LLFRAIFSGAVIASALILSRYFGPFWGAVVGGTYPASFGSQLMIFQSKYHARYLPSLIKTVPVGVLSTTVYSSIVVFCYDSIGIFMGTVVALTASLLTSSIVAIALRGVKDNNMLDQTSGPTNSVLV
jgi:branched-subunit amino acid transport protein AzlD